MNRDLKDVRENYQKAELVETEVADNPFVQFSNWFDDYKKLNKPDFNAMILGTVGEDGFPHTRVVLLKEIRNSEFVFFTNYNSDKGKHIDKNPRVSLLFFWPEREQQVRICGTAAKIPPQESTDYFHSRPIASQIGAITSPQSQIISSRAFLEEVFQENLKKFESLSNIPRPNNWGGFAIKPESFEFWQGRSSRLHDRIKYTKNNEGNWGSVRLAP
ncbi:MAG: pyridoxamine 5'-phosphate oxidase [Schleiferiaceae bacterium]|nr:pyridoxamine 5'-phosphate oxidase [Schleiferiaceae bacterium]